MGKKHVNMFTCKEHTCLHVKKQKKIQVLISAKKETMKNVDHVLVALK